MGEKRLDVHEFLKNDLMVEDICKTRRILGVFEDEIYCYFKEEIANNKSVTYFIDKIKNMETVSTKTFYNYIHDGKVSIKPIDLPRMLRRKTKRDFYYSKT